MAERSYGATCSDPIVGKNESFVDDIQDLFPVVHSGHTDRPLTDAMSFVVPMFVDFKRADEVIPVIEASADKVMHG